MRSLEIEDAPDLSTRRQGGRVFWVLLALGVLSTLAGASRYPAPAARGIPGAAFAAGLGAYPTPGIEGPFLIAAACAPGWLNALTGWAPSLDVNHPPAAMDAGPLHPSVDDPYIRSGASWGGPWGSQGHSYSVPRLRRYDAPDILSGGSFSGTTLREDSRPPAPSLARCSGAGPRKGRGSTQPGLPCW